MSVQQDDQGRRFIEVAVDVTGTPEAVWQAVATGPGISAWFVPTEVEEREGGTLAFDLGPGLSTTGRVTSWAPPHRLTYEETEWFGEAPPLATEVTVEAKAGGTCTVRIVHSLFTSLDDWDEQLESMETGWPPFFQVLRLYLTEFAGLPCQSVRLNGGSPDTVEVAWASLKTSLGLGESTVDGGVTFEPVPDAPLHGVDLSRDSHCGPRDVLLAISEPTTGIALFNASEWGGKVVLCVQIYYYGADAAAAVAVETPMWKAWLEEHFPEA